MKKAFAFLALSTLCVAPLRAELQKPQNPQKEQQNPVNQAAEAKKVVLAEPQKLPKKAEVVLRCVCDKPVCQKDEEPKKCDQPCQEPVAKPAQKLAVA